MSNGPYELDVAVVGGGVIGLALAWRARLRGLSVAVLERGEFGEGASHAAAGMLAPVAEAEFGEAGSRSLQLGLRSVSMWPAFAAELERASGVSVGLRRSGTLMVARDGDEARELERQIALRDSLGLRTERLRPSEARGLEPALAPTLRLALLAPEDHSLDPRLVASALRGACERGGVQLRERTPVASLQCEARHEHVLGPVLESGELVRARETVIAAGAWSGLLKGLPARGRVPVRPVKGQILRLRDPAGEGLVERVLRFEGGYLVPRGDGRYVLGASVEERGFDERPTAGAVHELLRDAHELVPGVSELEIDELSVGFRPGTPDNIPAIGRGGLEGLVWATGHHRNGILLAPLTAELLTGVLAGDVVNSPLLEACDPGRFAQSPVSSTGETERSPAGTIS